MTTITGCRRDPHDEPQHLRVKAGMIYCPECEEIIAWVGFELGEILIQRGMTEFRLGDKGRNRHQRAPPAISKSELAQLLKETN